MRTQMYTDCVVVGGGPAGLMFGLLLAREGRAVTVIEKHADFLRDFRGDTIHPSTQELLAQLGLLDELLRRPHSDMQEAQLSWHGEVVTLADFRHLPTSRQVMTFMPQWDFLDMIADAALKFPHFQPLRSTSAEGVIRDTANRVIGVSGAGPTGEVEVYGRLVVDASGRDSKIRNEVGLHPTEVAAAMDVLWFKLPKRPGERYPFMQAGAGMVITIDREGFFQIAYVIPAGTWSGDEASFERLLHDLRVAAPGIADSMGREQLAPSAIHLLKVRLEHLRTWHVDGMLCIGDAAHAMSPAGGVGINLAIQDAVAAAQILSSPLRFGYPTERELHRVQRRRAFPARLTQQVQRIAQGPLLSVTTPGAKLPRLLRLVKRFPRLTFLTGRFVGLGARPERIQRH